MHTHEFEVLDFEDDPSQVSSCHTSRNGNDTDSPFDIFPVLL